MNLLKQAFKEHGKKVGYFIKCDLDGDLVFRLIKNSGGLSHSLTMFASLNVDKSQIQLYDLNGLIPGLSISDPDMFSKLEKHLKFYIKEIKPVIKDKIRKHKRNLTELNKLYAKL